MSSIIPGQLEWPILLIHNHAIEKESNMQMAEQRLTLENSKIGLPNVDSELCLPDDFSTN